MLTGTEGLAPTAPWTSHATGREQAPSGYLEVGFGGPNFTIWRRTKPGAAPLAQAAMAVAKATMSGVAPRHCDVQAAKSNMNFLVILVEEDGGITKFR